MWKVLRNFVKYKQGLTVEACKHKISTDTRLNTLFYGIIIEEYIKDQTEQEIRTILRVNLSGQVVVEIKVVQCFYTICNTRTKRNNF